MANIITITPVTIHMPESTALAARHAPLLASAKGFAIADAGGHAEALNRIAVLRGVERQIEALFAEPKALAHRTHKAITGAEKALVDPLERTRLYYAKLCAVWETAERDRAERETRERELTAVEQAGYVQLQEAAHAEDPDAVLAQPLEVVTVAPVVAQVAAVEGVGRRVTHKARVTNLPALIAYVLQNWEGWGAVRGLVLANEKELGALARKHGKALRLPGVEVEEVTSYAVSGSGAAWAGSDGL